MNRLLLIVLTAAFTFANAEAAEIAAKTRGGKATYITITGLLERGDYQKFVDLINPMKSAANFDDFLNNSVVLDSTGGDVAEAYKIARLVEQTYAQTTVESGGKCFSSCFLIWAAGIVRYEGRNSQLGVHRIRLAAPEERLSKYEKAVVPAAQTIEMFLLRVGIPRKIIDKMNDTASTDIFPLTSKWLIEEGLESALSYRPFFLDAAEAKCGVWPDGGTYKANTSRPRATKEQMVAWEDCTDELRLANQSMEMDKIVALVVGRGGGAATGKQKPPQE